MRVLGARLTETLGQTFLVENRAGGDGYIGFDAVARSDADGHTLLYSPGSSMMIAPHIVNRPDLDPLKVLAPVAATGRVSLYVIAHPERPFKNFDEFVAYARANPGKLNYGTPGNGTSPHIATEVFNREAKVKLNHVPYKGAGPALQDLIGGQIDVVFDPGVGIAPAKAGKVRMLAIAGPQRHPDFPDIPTLEENGIKGVDGGPHFGLLCAGRNAEGRALQNQCRDAEGDAAPAGARALQGARRRRGRADDARAVRRLRARRARALRQADSGAGDQDASKAEHALGGAGLRRVLLRQAPVVDAARRPLPVLRPADPVVVADLAHFRGVLDHAAVGRDEVAEHVVARAVPPRSPHRLEARLAQARDAAHHRVDVAHLEGDVVERGELRLGIRDRVVLAVAAQEAHVRRCGRRP